MVQAKSENNQIKVGVQGTPSTTNINVTATNPTNPVQAANDKTQMYEQRALTHANNAKLYADQAQESAEQAQESNEAVTQKLEEVKILTNNALITINKDKNEAVAIISTLTEETVNSAIEQANIATENAEITIVQAANALESAKNAKTSETNALTYSNSANTSATTAKEQANISIEKAQESADYSELSKQWAISETLVDNADYSSKHYANVAKEEANKAELYKGQASQHAENAQRDANIASASSSSAYEYLEATTEQANISTTNAEISITQAGNALKSAENAALSEANAKESENKAKVSEQNAKSSEQRCEEIYARLGIAIIIKGRVDTLGDLPTTNVVNGDAYLVGVEGLDSYPEYYWYEDHWEYMGSTDVKLEWGNVSGTLSNQSDLQTVLNSKVGIANAETITGAKTFTGAVNLIGSGDSNAVTISTNTRFNVHNTSKTVLGFASGIFYINHGDYRLRLRGKDARPHYNSDSNYLALLSDIPDTSKFITMQDVEAKNYLTTIPDEYITETELNNKGYLTEHQDISNLATKTELTEGLATKQPTGNYALKSDIPDVSNFATKEELSDKQDTLTAGENITIENGVISASGGGKDLFDIVQKDHILTYEETEGYELLGNYVYKEAVAGSRYGYPDFYNKVLEEYNASTSKRFKKYKSSNYIEKVSNNNNSMKDVKGVLSGFKGEQYFKIPYMPSAPFEAVFKVRISDNVTTQQFIVGALAQYKGMQIAIKNGLLLVMISSNGSSWNVASAVTGTYQFSPNRSYTYYIRLRFTGTKYIFAISTDGENYTDDIIIESTAYIWSGYLKVGTNDNNDYPFLGSIDLNGCYITKEGEPWWTGCNYYEFDYVEHANGHKFYDIADKEAVDDLFNGCGMAWFYGVDTANERVCLPRNVWFEQLTNDVTELGSIVDAGLPNIEGTFKADRHTAYTPKGAFYLYDSSGATGADDTGTSNSRVHGFDAELYNSIYGNSDTVQPNAVKKLAYMVVGNTAVESAVTDVIDVTTSENDTIPLFHNFWSKEDMTTTGCYVNASLGGWLSGNVYITAYNTLVAKLGTGNVKSVSDAYTDYDFVVNADDMTFRLPLKNGQEIMFATGVKGNGNGIGVNSGTGYDFYLTQHAISNNATRYFTTNYYSATIPQIGTKLNLEAGKDKGVSEGVLGLSEDASKSGIVLDKENITIPDGWNLYYKVANAVQNIEILDVAGVTSDLNKKISKEECPRYVVEVSDKSLLPSWYVVYNDGWCEQGGTMVNAATTLVVSFLKIFSTTDYVLNVYKRGNDNDTGGYADAHCEVNGKDTYDYGQAVNGFRCSTSNASAKFTWEAKGYILEGIGGDVSLPT